MASVFATASKKGVGVLAAVRPHAFAPSHPFAPSFAVPAAGIKAPWNETAVIPRNLKPAHWSGKMQLQTEPRTDRPKPWNYKRRPFCKQYGQWGGSWNDVNQVWRYLDMTTNRLDEMSRVIVVDGNIGAGKTHLAKEIAKQFDLLYLQEPDSKMIYSGNPPFNYDMRDPAVQSHLHPRNRKYDLDDFYKEPHRKPARAAELQLEFYKMRYHQYCEACYHLLNTGQGVVLDRSIYSDHVFAETLKDNGYMPRKVHNWYYYLRRNTICNLWKPHLTIYLDSSVDDCMDRIKKRGIESEVNSKVLNETYLHSIEKHYKESFLPDMERSGELLVYEDYDPAHDPELVIEDISRLDFNYEIDDPDKFAQWRDKQEGCCTQYRIECGDEHYKQRMLMPPGQWRVEDIWYDGHLLKERQTAYTCAPGNLYAWGYEPGIDDEKKMMFDLFKEPRYPLRFLDRVPTPVLGEDYNEVQGYFYEKDVEEEERRTGVKMHGQCAS